MLSLRKGISKPLIGDFRNRLRNSFSSILSKREVVENILQINSSISRKMCSNKKIPIWLDCDPGHDDAFAILLAAYSPEINLLGISIVHGNDTVQHCALNANRFMWACGIQNIPVFQGVNRPIVRPAKHCPEIHGIPGEDGVAGMCGYHFPDDLIFADPNYKLKEGHGVLKMYEQIMEHPSKVTLVATGAQTNIAIALRLFPNMKDNIEQIVFMGGAIGVGNTGVAAEFNIQIDPEAAHILFHSGINLVMVPLEVTHSVLVTPHILKSIAKIDQFSNIVNDSEEYQFASTLNPPPVNNVHMEYEEIFKRIQEISKNINSEDSLKSAEEELLLVSECNSNFSRCCVQLLTFFGSTYKSVFSFDYPPLHDPCAIFYVLNPEAFKTMKMFVDVEMEGEKCVGRTLCDIHGISKQTTNVTVCFKLNVNLFWDKLLNSIKLANVNSPLNKLQL